MDWKLRTTIAMIFLVIHFDSGITAIYVDTNPQKIFKILESIDETDTSYSSKTAALEYLKINENMSFLDGMHPFYDAYQLRTAIKERKWFVMFKILVKYDTTIKNNKIEDIQFGELKNAYKANPILYDALNNIDIEDGFNLYDYAIGKYIIPAKAEIDTIVEEDEALKVLEQKSIDGIIMSTVSAEGLGENGASAPVVLLNALSEHMVKTAKEELIISFFRIFKDDMEKKQLNVFFPTTHKVLKRRYPSEYKSFLPDLRDASYDDLRNVLKNLATFLKDEKNRKQFGEKNIYPIVMIGTEVISSLIKSDHPTDVIQILITHLKRDSCSQVSKNAENALNLMNIVSNNLRGVGVYGDWIKSEELSELRNDEQLQYLFTGLLFEREHKALEKIEFNKKNLIEEIEKCRTNDKEQYKEYYLGIVGYVMSVAFSIIEVQAVLELIDEDGFVEDGEYDISQIENYRLYIQKVIKMFEAGFMLDILKDWDGYSDIKNTTEDIITKLNKGLEITIDISEERYGIAFIKALNILEETKPNDLDLRTLRTLEKYSSLMVNLVRAKDSKEVYSALDAIVLPVGSYRIKRYSAYNISLNSYLGLFAGGETAFTNKQINGNKVGGSLGLTSPIGLAFNWGRLTDMPNNDNSDNRDAQNKSTDKTQNKRVASVSLFFPFIDIAALASWRLGNDKAKDLPEFSAVNLLAPGAYLVIGLGNPLSIGIGAQYGPQVRKFEEIQKDFSNDADTGTSSFQSPIKSNNLRFGIFMGMDIPLFNFYTQVD